jgi:hypothetical protein
VCPRAVHPVPNCRCNQDSMTSCSEDRGLGRHSSQCRHTWLSTDPRGWHRWNGSLDVRVSVMVNFDCHLDWIENHLGD